MFQNVTAAMSNSTNNYSMSEEASLSSASTTNTTAAPTSGGVGLCQDYFSSLNQPFLQYQTSHAPDTPTTTAINASSPTSLQGQPSAGNKKPRKKRGLPGNPDPEAEIIALSPKSLLATNRFTCEVCNKGFQRDQNLQLHRRGHNLPWKLKQRNPQPNKQQQEEVNKRKAAYVCPEPSCVHHHPSRALGDLTGIKKHFCRKHGEKKFGCDKCGKVYAVQSDWKAHSKTCGTKEYRCDCGTLFSRKDSFITHRAFCDALAEESARLISEAVSNPFIARSSVQNDQTPPPPLFSFSAQNQPPITDKQWPHPHHHQNPNYIHASPPSKVNYLISPVLSVPPPPSTQTQVGVISTSFRRTPEHSHAHLSATALLQKACTMGVTMSHGNQAEPSRSQQELYAGRNSSTDDGNEIGTTTTDMDPTTCFINGPVIGHVGTAGHDEQVVHTMRPPPPSSSSDDHRRQYLLGQMMMMRSTPPGDAADHLTRDFLGLTGTVQRHHHQCSSNAGAGGAADAASSCCVSNVHVLRYTDGSLLHDQPDTAATVDDDDDDERYCLLKQQQHRQEQQGFNKHNI